MLLCPIQHLGRWFESHGAIKSSSRVAHSRDSQSGSLASVSEMSNGSEFQDVSMQNVNKDSKRGSRTRSLWKGRASQSRKGRTYSVGESAKAAKSPHPASKATARATSGRTELSIVSNGLSQVGNELLGSTPVTGAPSVRNEATTVPLHSNVTVPDFREVENDPDFKEVEDGYLDVSPEFSVGDRCVVDSRGPGTIMFNGLIKGQHRFGIALDKPNGLNDGSAFGKKYFDCQPHHGLFCKAQQVSEETVLLPGPVQSGEEFGGFV